MMKYTTLAAFVLGLAVAVGPPAYGADDQATANLDAGENCCVIIGIDRHVSVVTAEDKTGTQRFRFVVRDRAILGTLRPGQVVSANFSRMEASFAPACAPSPCEITEIWLSPNAVARHWGANPSGEGGM